ncbi:voltage-dependent anion channel-domain-containing protein [Armillaria novae-zelandiae]|uniref:Voltage-dependent anion channel-domain-containing protein n=1 Tax=Armillaria novae-zelandiae TaxID=153914 RepID=A0AA39NYK9_9AGAR|nr:voltage-dependent anion channel-domain-containing protein [Armillaria novae-zelandiae]
MQTNNIHTLTLPPLALNFFRDVSHGMGTGMVYVTLAGLEDHFNALTKIETAFYFINMALFVFNTCTLLLQTIHASLLHVLSFATIIIGTFNYAFPSGHVTAGFIYALFWVYVIAAFNKPHDLMHFTPAYAFLIFPMMLVGIVSFNVLRVMDPIDPRALGVLLVGYFFQGLGSFMTFFYLCIYVICIMTTGFLEGHQANRAFVACGPPGFTALALIRLADEARTIVLAGLLLYGLAIFFFIFGVLPYWYKLHKNLNKILGCWALTFPNIGWISTTRIMGDIFGIEFLYIIHLCLTIVMVLTWCTLFMLTVVVLCRGLIFKSKEEDVLKDILPAYNEHEENSISVVADEEQGTLRPIMLESRLRQQ